MPNLCAKTRDISAPYEVWQEGGREWRVLKKYQMDDHKPYARWLCAVKSPYTHGGWDWGDVYAADVMNSATRVL